MEDKVLLEEQINAVIKNQIVSSYPPETKITFSRLQEMGFKEDEINKMIGQCLSIEMTDVLKNKKELNRNRYVQNLNRLPELP